jgi:hypothetical protein
MNKKVAKKLFAAVKESPPLGDLSVLLQAQSPKKSDENQVVQFSPGLAALNLRIMEQLFDSDSKAEVRQRFALFCIMQ